jgi:hypothetical protein
MVGDVADVVESVLDFPLSAYEGGCLWCGRLLGCEVGDVPRGFGGDDLVVEGAPFPVGANDLFGVGNRPGGAGAVAVQRRSMRPCPRSQVSCSGGKRPWVQGRDSLVEFRLVLFDL